MKINKLLLALLFAGASYQAIAAVPAMVSNGVLTGSNGMSLYIFDKDEIGSAKCWERV